MSDAEQQRRDAELARAMAADAPRWPRCTRCGQVAKPGVRCELALCPWMRVQGVILGA